MNKLLAIIYSVFLFTSIAQAEDIITSAYITSAIINLGEDTKIQFNVNQVKLCDNYTIETLVDYIAKKIEINVNYNYISSCNESILISTEIVNKPILLEGIYNVQINLNVPNNSNWDKTIYLSTISVNNPFNQSCYNNNIPYLSESCPTLIDQVCACDGQNYDNECDAYLLNGNGIYIKTLCGIFIEQSSLPFTCTKFQSSYNNLFSKYNCSEDNFEGEEIYLKYNQQDNDSLIINFKSDNESVRLFLTKLVDDNIVCLAISDNFKLEYPDLPIGTYYIIADNDENYSFEIEFCAKTAIDNEMTNKDIEIYPNPIDNYVEIKSKTKINKINIFDVLGIKVYSKLFNKSNIIIDNNFFPGMYIIQVETNLGIITKKITIN